MTTPTDIPAGPGDGAAIDAVITWVDGNDPAHRAKREAALATAAGHDRAQTQRPIAAGRDSTRFLDNGELAFCLASLHRFAPWLRRIHLVTDGQRPDFLDAATLDRYRVTIVDHREIFAGYEWAMPCFNSRSIETLLWRIPELSDRFLYLNDDFILTRPQHASGYFDDGKVILRGSWQRLRLPGNAGLAFNQAVNRVAKRVFGVTRTMHLLAQMRGAALAGQAGNYFRTPHIPHPLRRDTLADFYTANPTALEDNIRFPFRDLSQHLSVALADHLEILADGATLLPESGAAIVSGEYRNVGRMRDTIAAAGRGELDVLCLGGVEKLDAQTRQALDTTLRALLQLEQDQG